MGPTIRPHSTVPGIQQELKKKKRLLDIDLIDFLTQLRKQRVKSQRWMAANLVHKSFSVVAVLL